MDMYVCFVGVCLLICASPVNVPWFHFLLICVTYALFFLLIFFLFGRFRIFLKKMYKYWMGCFQQKKTTCTSSLSLYIFLLVPVKVRTRKPFLRFVQKPILRFLYQNRFKNGELVLVQKNKVVFLHLT